MRKRSRWDYAYAVGRVRALEKYLLPRPLLVEALNAMDIASGLKIIYETGLWPEDFIQAKTPEDVDRISLKEIEKLDRLMAELLETDVFLFFQAQRRLEDLLARAQKTGYLFFIEYSRHCLDLANIKIFLRFNYSGESAETLEKHLVSGGYLNPQILKTALGQSWPDLHPLLAKTDYGRLWEKALIAIEEKNTFVVLEREMENFLIHFWRRAKEITFGPEPVFVYGLARRREIELVRLISLGRMLQLPPELIRERLSETYG